MDHEDVPDEKGERRSDIENATSILDWLRRISVRKLGLAGLLAMSLLTGATYVVLNWQSLSKNEWLGPPLKRATQKSIPKADSRRFSVALARLENDPDREQERLLRRLLQEFKGIEVLSLDRTIATSGPVSDAVLAKGHAEARSYLKKSGASVVLWGSVLRLGNQTNFDLNFTGSAGTPLSLKQYTPEAAGEFRLPGVFWQDVLRLLVTASWSDFQESTGRPVAADLAPFIERVRNLLDSPGGPSAWDSDARQSTHIVLAQALRRLSREIADPKPLDEAISIYELVLREMDRNRSPRRWATVQRSLGNVLTVRGDEGGGTGYYQRAIPALTAAAEVFDGLGDRNEWADTQHKLANTQVAIAKQWPAGGDTTRFNAAFATFERALAAFRATGNAEGWASAQNDLGVAFRERAVRSKTMVIADLDRAVECYKAALKVHTPALRQRWAATQFNLGVALLEAGDSLRTAQSAGERELGKRYAADAIRAFVEARKVYTAVVYRLDWAETSNSLGNAYALLGELGPDASFLDRAVAVYEEAQQVRTRTRYPRYWAYTQINRAEAIKSIGSIKGNRETLLRADQAYLEADAVLRQLSDRYGIFEVSKGRQMVRDELRKLAPDISAPRAKSGVRSSHS